MNPILAPWLVECVILSGRSVKRDHRPPLPSEFVATFVIFGAASLVATKEPQLAALFSWGIVTATLLNLWNVDGKLRLGVRQSMRGPVSPEKLGNRPYTNQVGDQPFTK